MDDGTPGGDKAAKRRAILDAAVAVFAQRGSLRQDIDIPLARRMQIGSLEEIELDWLLGQRTRPLSPLAPSLARAFLRGIVAEPS